MNLYIYMPLLITACMVTFGYALACILGGGGIDPGAPNARV